MENKILHGDCLDLLKDLDDNSVDSIVTDPPYGLSFMGKKWDYDVPSVEIWKECLRVLKPGGYLLSFAGTRTQHRMAVNIEDAGFEIRDMIAWVYGSGFPKSHNIGKAVDKLGGQSLDWFIDYILKFADEKGISRKELTMIFPSKTGKPTGWLWNKQKTQGITIEQFNKIKDFLKLPFDSLEETEREIIGRGEAGLTAGTIANFSGEKEFDLTEGNSPYEGWGTALKPALEPITVARKPFKGTVANNVLKWGTGGINIDGCRVGVDENEPNKRANHKNHNVSKQETNINYVARNSIAPKLEQGRFPANLIHDGSDEVVGLFPETTKAGNKKNTKSDTGIWGASKETDILHKIPNDNGGSAARFFYCAKASKSERNKGLEDIEGKYLDESRKVGSAGGTNPRNRGAESKRKNFHPTVKPIKLMQYLVRLVTPKDGTVLDPFVGSGTTCIAAKLLDRKYIGMEMDDEYVVIAQERIKAHKPDKTQHDFF